MFCSWPRGWTRQATGGVPAPVVFFCPREYGALPGSGLKPLGGVEGGLLFRRGLIHLTEVLSSALCADYRREGELTDAGQ